MFPEKKEKIHRLKSHLDVCLSGDIDDEVRSERCLISFTRI